MFFYIIFTIGIIILQLLWYILFLQHHNKCLKNEKEMLIFNLCQADKFFKIYFDKYMECQQKYAKTLLKYDPKAFNNSGEYENIYIPFDEGDEIKMV